MMCLSVVDRSERVSRSDGITAFKVAVRSIEHHTTICYHWDPAGRPVDALRVTYRSLFFLDHTIGPTGEWLVDRRHHEIIGNTNGPKYPAGFHAYLERCDAENQLNGAHIDIEVIEVLLAGILTRGREATKGVSVPVVVGSEMKIVRSIRRSLGWQAGVLQAGDNRTVYFTIRRENDNV